jgi:hypothetical protein
MPLLPSLASQLATLHAGRPLALGDPTVQRAQRLLDSLGGKYPAYSYQALADISVRAHDVLRARGGTLLLLDFMDAIERATPAGSHTLRYEESCLTLIRLLTPPQTP